MSKPAPPKLQEPLITSTLPGWIGLLTLLLTLFLIRHSAKPAWEAAALCMGTMFFTMSLVEAWQCQGRGLLWKTTPKSQRPWRIIPRLVGLGTSICLISSAYWIFPEYAGNFYQQFYQAVSAYWPWLAGFFVLTTWLENIKAPEDTKDPNYQIGRAVLTLTTPTLTKAEWQNHFLGWIIKLYFLPLMFIYFCNHIDASKLADRPTSLQYYDFAYSCLFLVDTAFVCVGYTFANKITGTHIRSADKTAAGWVSALVCYQPFWGVISGCYIAYGQNWGRILPQNSTFQLCYGSLIILSLVPYLWATLTFGTRFSNLTHRGIICTGPYKYFRHPAYLSKLTCYFLAFTPYLSASLLGLVQNLVIFGLLCFIYRIRAVTEERNLRSLGPDYDIYCQQVRENRKNLFSLFKNPTRI